MSRFAAANEPGTDALAGTPLSEPLGWANTQLVAGDAVEAVREMKANASKSMRTIGSLTLSRSLLKVGLVDSGTFDGRIQLLEYATRSTPNGDPLRVNPRVLLTGRLAGTVDDDRGVAVAPVARGFGRIAPSDSAK
jgi:hypothetical protein